jgi:DNA-binding transcriptional ArsR family regulator
VAGWIKLWRKLKINGHLKMPGTAFKLWIYCLLEASPYPDQSRSLETGELWLNYEHVRQVIGEAGRQMSKSTVSSALKYLEQNGYIYLEAKRFYGVKVRVAGWREYQLGARTARVQKPYPDKAAGPGVNPDKARPGGLPGTETVPADNPPGTAAGTVTSTATSTEIVPVPVPARVAEPISGAAYSEPKNIKNKELKNKDIYSVVAAMAAGFAQEFGRPLSPIETNQLANCKKSSAVI